MLNESQKRIVTSYAEKIATIAATALIFGQFVPGQEGRWELVLIGAALSILCIIFAVIINKTYEPLH